MRDEYNESTGIINGGEAVYYNADICAKAVAKIINNIKNKVISNNYNFMTKEHNMDDDNGIVFLIDSKLEFKDNDKQPDFLYSIIYESVNTIVNEYQNTWKYD